MVRDEQKQSKLAKNIGSNPKCLSEYVGDAAIYRNLGTMKPLKGCMQGFGFEGRPYRILYPTRFRRL